MGADMITWTLWAETDPTTRADEVLAAVGEALAAADLADLLATARFVGIELDDLTVQVLRADPTTHADFAAKTTIAYGPVLEDFLDTFTGRGVNTMRLGPLTGFVTGGLSYGDSPTDTYNRWETFFTSEADEWDDEEDDMYGAYRNPMANLVASILFISPVVDWAVPGQRAVDAVTFTVAPAAATEPVPAPMA
jgi:hypothetical protein